MLLWFYCIRLKSFLCIFLSMPLQASNMVSGLSVVNKLLSHVLEA